MRKIIIPKSIDCSNCRSRISKDMQGFHYYSHKKGQEISMCIKNYHQIIFLLKGSFSISYEEVENYICNEHHMLLLMNRFNYRLTFLEDSEMVILVHSASIQICDNLEMADINHFLNTTYVFSSLEMKELMIELINTIANYTKQGGQCLHLHKAKQLELFIIFSHYYTIEENMQFFSRTMQKDIDFYSIVMTKHGEAKNVEELAKLCGYGLSNFKKLFIKHFGTSPYKWMIQQTSQKLRERLMDKSIPLKVIASEFHFTDQSNFGAFCRRHLSATPLEIREGKKKQTEQ